MTKTAAVFCPTAENLAFANSTVQSLDALCASRVQWEATDYKKANEGLYALLADCLSVFNNKFMKGTDNDRRTLRKELTARLTHDGVKVQRNSTTLTMFVRFVFGSDRKRAHGYTYVMKAALSWGISAEALPAYIAEQGGIEEIKRRMVISEEAQQRRADLEAAKVKVGADVERATIAPIATIALAGVTGEYAVLIAKPTPDGMVNVVGVLSDVNAALYQQLVARIAKTQVTETAANAGLRNEADMLGASVPEEQTEAVAA